MHYVKKVKNCTNYKKPSPVFIEVHVYWEVDNSILCTEQDAFQSCVYSIYCFNNIFIFLPDSGRHLHFHTPIHLLLFFIWKNKKISSIFPLVFFSLPFFSISPWRSAPALPSPPLHSLLITFLCWGPPRGKPASEVKMNGGKAKEWRIKYWQSEKWWVIKYDKHGQQKWWSLYLYVMKEPCISLYLSTSLFWELPREAPKAPGSLFGNWQFVVTVFLANLFGNMHHCTMSTEMVRELRGLLPSLVILRHCVGVGLFNAPVDIIFICGISPNSCMFNQRKRVMA